MKERIDPVRVQTPDTGPSPSQGHQLAERCRGTSYTACKLGHGRRFGVFISNIRKNTDSSCAWSFFTRGSVGVTLPSSCGLRAHVVDPNSMPINLGTGVETSIRELSDLIGASTGFRGEVHWDTTRSEGQPRRYTNLTRMRTLLGLEPAVKLADGVAETVAWYQRLTKVSS